MKPLVVLENPARWPLRLPAAEIVAARDYIESDRWASRRGARVFNLCRRYGFQTTGYYVSLLAEARGHRPLPSVATLQDLRLSPVVRVVSEDLDQLIATSLKRIRSSRFELSVYFGANLARKYDRLAAALFRAFPVPLLRAVFVRADRWRLDDIRPIASSEIPVSHRPFIAEQAARHFAGRGGTGGRRKEWRWDLALLVEKGEETAPSNASGLQRIERALRAEGIRPWRIGREDFPRLAEYDALFLRATTAVDHYTYRFARRAEAEGLVVIDDPRSILRCGNKVFLAEAFRHAGIPHPPTVIAQGGDGPAIVRRLGLPCVLKQPDGAFSAGVYRVATPAELEERLASLLEDSELVIAQQWTPSKFDWRIGVLDGRPLWACRYWMAPGHWQIRDAGPGSAARYGRVETLAVNDAPADAIDLALRAARLIGRGLYGVDLKEIDGHFLVMEINDNPNLDGGYEDSIAGPDLWRTIARTFRERIEKRGAEA